MSKETKFTKSCWILHPDGAITDNSPAENEICFIDGSDNKLEDQDYSNAHLIKTAPKLYALLERYHLESRFVYGEDYDEVEELLAEARGL